MYVGLRPSEVDLESREKELGKGKGYQQGADTCLIIP